MLETARVLYAYRDQAVTVVVDGGPPEHLAITNYGGLQCRYFGGGMNVRPGGRGGRRRVRRDDLGGLRLA